MVFPKNFDNPDEVFALAKLWAKRRERKLLDGEQTNSEILAEPTLDEFNPEQNPDTGKDDAR